ncbi:sugar transporter, putative [Talaromyces stipitatus ATCC 10500]|uniref:Sugar transporter, putative n=1 Tax=Talaromyces stipitatus (strain ATCC 10500 / CBS 375.48 / QM 6759 / NRRL 1006) TaxID=441959 RepID=B8MAE6_TALSN|nr:sugar transporter, putative [Talaromyces stipitatus ATCC 10500]EED18648.1 sugar transporter, putative [Talaromyces stipitatus ATCC 10500]
MKNPFTLHVKNRTVNFDHIRDLKLRRRRVLDELDRTHFQWLVVFVAGVGFLADGYDIYAASLTIPMLNHVYWNNQMGTNIEASLNAAVLAGTVIGQLGFGIFADVFGRKSMYGLELLIIIGSTVGITMSSPGTAGSMDLLGWLISWRVLLGVGIGGDYPLSAVITSEFAPTRSRGRMLASVFFMQPFGYLLATVVCIIALAAYKPHLTQLSTDGNMTCVNDECRRALDSVWRWVIGLGTIPAALAIFLRFSIPESPRYTIEVLNRPDEALEDVNDMDLPTVSSPTPHEGGVDANVHDMEMNHDQHVPDFDEHVMHEDDDPLDGEHAAEQRSWISSPGSPTFRDASSTTAVDETVSHHVSSAQYLSATEMHSPTFTSNGEVSFTRAPIANNDRPPSSALSPTMLSRQSSHESGSSSSESDGADVESRNVWAIYRSGLNQYLWEKGHWVVLLGTSMTWFCFDFAFYVMGPNSYQVVSKVFNTSSRDGQDVYTNLMTESWHSLVIVSLGAILGGICMIYLVGRISPRKLQLAGFLIVFVLFIVVGLVFRFLSAPSRTPLVVFLYVISMIFFQIGPNFTTYIIPSELFPTQLRCTAVGISAAAGKTAAVIVQIFASLSRLGPHGDSNEFGYGIIVFSAFMLIGAALTKWLTPETRADGMKPVPLEKLEYAGPKWPVKSRKSRNKEEVCMEVTNAENHNGASGFVH